MDTKQETTTGARDGAELSVVPDHRFTTVLCVPHIFSASVV